MVQVGVLSGAFCAVGKLWSGGCQTSEGVKLGVLNDLSGAFANLGGKGSIVAAQMAVDDFGRH